MDSQSERLGIKITGREMMRCLISKADERKLVLLATTPFYLIDYGPAAFTLGQGQLQWRGFSKDQWRANVTTRPVDRASIQSTWSQ